AADAGAAIRILSVDLDAERRVERLEPGAREVLGQLLQPRLVAHGGVRIRRARVRVGRVFAALTVHVVHALRAGIEGLQLVVRDGPGGRDAAVVTQLAKVLLAQPEEG